LRQITSGSPGVETQAGSATIYNLRVGDHAVYFVLLAPTTDADAMGAAAKAVAKIVPEHYDSVTASSGSGNE
jgi:hypothetical protein